MKFVLVWLFYASALVAQIQSNGASSSSTMAAQAVVVSTPTGEKFARQALAAVGTPSAHFSAKAHVTVWLSGKEEDGTAELLASGSQTWRMEIATSSVRFSEANVRGHRLFRPPGEASIYEEPVSLLGAEFSPANSLLMRAFDKDVHIDDLGAEQFAGVSTDHLRLRLGRTGEEASVSATNRRNPYTEEEFFLDRTSHLVLGIRYVYMAEEKAVSAQPCPSSGSCGPSPHRHYPVPIEIHFSDFRNVDGHQIPFSIDRYAMGHHVLHIAIDAVDLSKQLAVPDFEIR